MSISAGKIGWIRRAWAAQSGLDQELPQEASSASRTRVVGLTACVCMMFIFTLDVSTPATFSYWPYGLPIMLAALTTNTRLTWALVVAGLLANLAGTSVDRLEGDVVWSHEYVQNRILAVTGAFVSGFLTMTVQRASARAARVGALQLQNARELAVSNAADQILGALSMDRVLPTVATEAVKIFDAALAIWVPAQSSPSALVARRDGEMISLTLQPTYPELTALAGEPSHPADYRPEWKTVPEGLRGANQLGSSAVLSVPVAGSLETSGTLLVVPASGEVDDAAIPSAHSFARIASSAIEEARLLRELAAQNQSLQERQQVIQDLVDAISHDVRTPLEALSMTLGQAIDGEYGPLPAEYAEVLTESRISIDEIYRLAETLLVVARFEAGATAVAQGPISLDVLADELLIEFRALGQARKIELRSQLERNAIVEGSGPNLRRAIANLVANAVRHTPPGGCVELSVKSTGSEIVLTVADNGFGVDESVRPMLFQRFARGVGTGSGLGLYIVRRVAESMGGVARYEPRSPHGSSFSIALPRSPAAVPAA